MTAIVHFGGQKIMKPKKLSNKHESFIADYFGGKTVIASGALYFAKGDVITDNYLIECKATEKDYYTLKKSVITKIRTEAIKCGRIPLLAIRVQDRDFIVHRMGDFMNGKADLAGEFYLSSSTKLKKEALDLIEEKPYFVVTEEDFYIISSLDCFREIEKNNWVGVM